MFERIKNNKLMITLVGSLVIASALATCDDSRDPDNRIYDRPPAVTTTHDLGAVANRGSDITDK